MNQKNCLKFNYQYLLALIFFAFGTGSFAQPAPTGLAQVTPVSGQVNLIWTPVAYATAYQISRQLLDLTDTATPTPTGTLTPTSTYAPITVISASVFPVQTGTPVFTDFQVTDGRSYQYSVEGIGASGIPGNSAAVTALPYTVPAVVNPSVSNIHANSVDLSWSVPLSTFPIASYNIYRQNYAAVTTPSIPASVFFTSSPTPIAVSANTFYTDQTASASVSNYYAVVAVDSQSTPATGLFPSSSTNGALAINSLPPVAPALIVVGYGTVTPNVTPTPVYGAQLIWNGPVTSENVTNYVIYANGTPISSINLGSILPTYSFSFYTTPTPTGTFNTSTITNTPTVTSTFTSSSTPTFTSSPTGTLTPTYSPTITPTPTNTGTFTPTFVPYTLLPGVLTSYSVVAINANGAVTSNSVSAEILAPSMSGGITVTPNETPNATTNAVTVAWGQGSTGTYGLIASYAVYRGISGVPIPYATAIPSGTPYTATPTPFVRIWETPSRTPTLTAIDSIANPNGYTYWVQPFDNIGTGGNIVVATPAQLDLAPTPVTTVTIAYVNGTNNKVMVSWAPASTGFYGNITNYNIYRFVNTPTGTQTPVATVGATRTTRNDYVDNNSTVAASYAVGAVDALGNVSDLSILSSPVILNPVGSFSPQTPRALRPAQNGNYLTFSWLLNPASDNVTEYDVYGSSYYSVIGTQTPIAIVLTATPVITATAPPGWSSSTFYVQAINSVGGNAPATLSAIAVPVPVYSVTAVVQATQGVNISWSMVPPPTATPNVDSVVIYRALAHPVTTPEYFQPIATVSISTPTFLDVNVTPGTQYLYMVTGRSNNFLSGTPTPVFESPVSVTGMAYPTVITWPNVPAGVYANTGSGATTLFWTPNPTPDAVQVYTFLRDGVPVTPTMTAVFAETQGNISTYQVFANNAGGSSNGSVTLSVLAIPSMTPTVLLTPPTYVMPVSSPTPMVWISGLAYPTEVAGYTIYRATDPAFVTGVPVATAVAPTPFVTDSGQPGYVNYYKAVANNGAGVTANFTLSGLLAINLWPNPPSSFSANAGLNAVTLSWSAPVSGSSPVTAYDVYRGLASGAETPIATVIARGGSFVDSQVTPGNVYYYTMDSIGTSLNSVTTSEQAVIPGPAPILNGVTSNGQALLTWSPVAVATTSPITEYVVSKLTMPTPGASALTPTYPFTTSNLTTTSYNDSAIAFNTGYAYKVAPIAIATSGVTIYGSYSNSVTLVESAQGPTNVNAVSGDQLVQLRWNYQGTFANNTYSIQRKLGTAPVSAYQTIASGLNGLDYTDTGLLDKTLYNYQIIAVPTASATLTGVSQPVNALPAHPPVVDNAALTLVQSQTGNTISWQAANSGVTDFNSATMYPLGGYSIYRSSDGGGTYQLLQSQGVSLTSYMDQVTIINGASYTYQVFAFDAPPNVNTNNPNMIHQSVYNTITAAGLTESVALDRNSIRPFGSSNEQVVHIRFVVTNSTNVQIKVYTLSGVFVKQLVNQSFGAGVYGIAGSGYPLVWDGHNASGDLVASGVYLITTEMNGLQTINKIAVIK